MALNKSWISLACIATGAALAALVSYAILMHTLPTTTIHVAEARVVVEIADTPAARERGLGGRDVLPAGRGMLFDMGSDAEWGFWMKDMRFAIDIVWLARDGTVVYIAANVAPDTYPQVFAPPSPAYWVLELPAGYMAASGVGIGERVVL